jgi:predicted porin
MKFKTTAIAMAVAGVVAAPIVAQAEGSTYASARIGVWQQDSGGESELDIRSFSSRFGAKGETDLGNGMTGFGRYEWDVDLGEGGGLGVRHRYVGLKGDFGSVLVGQTYHTFYNFNVGAVDIPWWHSGYNMVSYTSRTDNALTYSGGTDSVAFGLTLYMDADVQNGSTDPNAEDGVDGVEAGASFGIGDMTLAIAFQDIAVVDDAVTGVSLSGVGLGPVMMAFNYQTNDDQDGITLHADINNFYVHIESLSDDASGQDPLALTLGYTQSLGSKTTMYYEIFDFDRDTGNSDDDSTNVMAVLKYDII